MAAESKPPRERTSRRNALAAIELWYGERLYLGQAKFRKARGRVQPDVPDEYVRPEGFIGPPVRTDGVTAHGVETKPYQQSRTPWESRGAGSRLDVVRRDEAEAMRQSAALRAETIAIMNFTMIRVQLLDPLVATAIELWGAGWKFNQISTALGVSKNLAHQFFERGVSQIEFALLVNPDRRAGLVPPQPRYMLMSDLRQNNLPVVRQVVAEDLGLSSTRNQGHIDASP